MPNDDADRLADALIEAEVAKQDDMWGDANERSDASKSQMLDAATAHCVAVRVTEIGGVDRSSAFQRAGEQIYPKDWSGFRDYGSDVANLVVAAAYLRNEIKRRIRNGDSTYRAPRRADQPYNPATGLPKE